MPQPPRVPGFPPPWSGRPLRAVVSRAPIRICDNGGWTDTWFARHGRVFNIAVTPLVEVRIDVFRSDGRPDRVLMVPGGDTEPYARWPENPAWEQHPLLEAAIQRIGVPDGLALRVKTSSDVPAGASTGTSAAVTVALVGGLASVASTPLGPDEAAALAHSIETDTLGWQAGVQDQVAAARGGINFIEVEYPRVKVEPVAIDEPVRAELESRLVLVYLGRSHMSSAIHEQVIRQLEGRGPDCRELDDLRESATRARDAVLAGDLGQLGRAMIENTGAQARLHPDLVGIDARRVVALAKAHGAGGWKVNGAGGAGGSITLLAGPGSGARQTLVEAIQRADPRFRHIPVRISFEGLHTTDTAPA